MIVTTPVDEASVRQNDVETQDVVNRATIEYGMRAARVVRDHPADRRTAARRDVRGELESVWRERRVELIQDDARLHDGDASLGVNLEDAVQMARAIELRAVIHGRASQAGPRAARSDRNAQFRAGAYRLLNIRGGCR